MDSPIVRPTANILTVKARKLWEGREQCFLAKISQDFTLWKDAKSCIDKFKTRFH